MRVRLERGDGPYRLLLDEGENMVLNMSYIEHFKTFTKGALPLD